MTFTRGYWFKRLHVLSEGAQCMAKNAVLCLSIKVKGLFYHKNQGATSSHTCKFTAQNISPRDDSLVTFSPCPPSSGLTVWNAVCDKIHAVAVGPLLDRKYDVSTQIYLQRKFNFRQFLLLDSYLIKYSHLFLGF